MAILTKQNKIVLTNRAKSFLWRLGMMFVAVLINFVLANLELLNISPDMTVLLGLILGEVSKYLNIDLPEMKRTA